MTPDQVNQETSGEPLTPEQAVARLEDVQRLTDAALAYLDLDDLLNELLNRVKEILRVDTTAVLLVEDDGRTLAARAAKGLEEEVERGFVLPIGRGFAGRIAATKQPVVIPDLDDAPLQPVNPLFREKRIRSLLGVPLIVEGEVKGVLHVGSLTPRDFRGADVELLQMVGDRERHPIADHLQQLDIGPAKVPGSQRADVEHPFHLSFDDERDPEQRADPFFAK